MRTLTTDKLGEAMTAVHKAFPGVSHETFARQFVANAFDIRAETTSDRFGNDEYVVFHLVMETGEANIPMCAGDGEGSMLCTFYSYPNKRNGEWYCKY